jgi:nucleoside-triphosphatase THEP1
MRHKPIFIVGPVNSRKTTFLYTLCSRLDCSGYKIGGVIQVMPIPGQEKKDWELSDQSSGETRLLMTTTFQPEFEQFGRFWVDYKTFDWAHERIIAAMQSYDVLTFDEIGPLELAGKALHATLHQVFSSYQGIIIAVVREKLLDAVLQTYGIPNNEALVLHVQKPWEEELGKVVMCE